MTETKIKLCGMMRPEDVKNASGLNPDYIGVILSKGFKRSVDPDELPKFREVLGEGIPLVGVFVDEPVNYITYISHMELIDVIQLHGKESDEDVLRVKNLTKKPVIKAFKITSKEDVKKAESSHADMVLLDAGTGTGELFDWELIKDVKRDYILAGGLDSNNVINAISSLHPYGVDVSSGIETDGKKDMAKMAEFVRKGRQV